jgi:hypothetical protein
MNMEYTDSEHYQYGSSINSIGSSSRIVGWLRDMSNAPPSSYYSGKGQCHIRKQE